MNAVFSWVIVMLLFACAWLAADRIGKVFDWVLDHMNWTPNKPIVGTDDPCPCGQDRTYHDRKASL
jgi:hypothetical protein